MKSIQNLNKYCKIPHSSSFRKHFSVCWQGLAHVLASPCQQIENTLPTCWQALSDTKASP